MVEERVRDLERRMDVVVNRLCELETADGRTAPPVREPLPESPSQRPSASAPTPLIVPTPPASEPAPASAEAAATPPKSLRRSRPALEDLLGGQVLAWVGGITTLLGLVFLLAIGVSSGWIGEGARTLLAGITAGGLLGVGVWLHERRGRTDAALAAVAVGIAAAFVTVTVAAQVYDLIPVELGLGLALLVGALSTVLAVRWEAQGMAALGLVGALLAPVLAGASAEAGSVALLFVAGTAAAGVLVWMRWEWLSVAAFAVATPQWVPWLFDGASTQAGLVALTAFGVLGVVTAVGYELRSPSERLRASSTFLLVVNALVVATAGWFALGELGHQTLASLWLVALATGHLGIGLCGTRLRRVTPDLALISSSAGVVLADLAFGLIASGPVLVAGWSATAVLFAAVARRSAVHGHDRTALQLGLGAHIGLSLAHALGDAPPAALVDGGALTATAAIAVLALAAGCFASARLADEGHPELRVCLDALGLAAIGYLTALTVDGWQLAVAWSLEAAALARLAARGRELVAAWGAAAFGAAALTLSLLVVATPDSLVYGLVDPLGAAAALGVVAAVCGLGAYLRIGDETWRRALIGVSAMTLLYLASAAVVTPFQPGSGAAGTVFELGVRQQGQMLLSVFWALVGVAALAVGLRGESLRLVRLAALGLLGVAAGKVFMFDLATLTSVYRVVSFVGLGLVLLGAAFLWERMRPRPLSDLRDTPAGIR